MSHDILGEHFAAHGHPAWHGLGITFHESLNATQAVELAGGNYPVTLSKLYAVVDETHIPISNSYAVVRGPLTPAGDREQTEAEKAPAVLGTCSRKFAVMDNLELAALLDPLTEHFPVETFGVLDNGERVFFCLRSQENSEIQGEEIHNYFTVTDTKTPGHTARVFYSPVRVVCQNTLTRGINAASIMVSIRHRRTVRDEFKFYTTLVTRMATERENTLDAFRRMAALPVPSETALAIIADTFPIPTVPEVATAEQILAITQLASDGVKGADAQLARAEAAREHWEQAYERTKELRTTAGTLLERFNDSHPRTAGTLWAVYNACTELSDWRPGRGNIARSVLFGIRAAEKARAYRICLDYIARN